MTIRAAAVVGSALIGLGTALFPGCSAPPSATAAAPATDAPAATPRREQALLDDLALANRILARQLDILDIQGHVTARSLDRPDHYYIARYVAPGGATTEHFIENTLESVPVDGPRTDQAREIYLHGEVYRARPDVMAVVHSHTPEFVAFGMSAVPLYSGATQVPVSDIRPFNRDRSGIVSTPALGRAMAETLGRHDAVLLWGHGIAFTAASIAEAIAGVDALRDSAQRQQAVVAMGGRWAPLAADEDGAVASRQTWDYHKAIELKRTGGQVPMTAAEPTAKPADPDAAAVRDVVLANRILTSGELGFVDTHGLVSMRHPGNPNSYFVAPDVAPGAVTAGSVIQRDITKAEPGTRALTMHDEIYRARPDVKAIVYARTPEIVAFTDGPVALRPVVNGAAFIGPGFPVFNGGSAAGALGRSGALLLPRDGIVLTAGSIYNLTDRAYQLRQNATIQRQALALRGRVAYLNERPPQPAPAREPTPPAPTGLAEGRAWIYWSENVTLD